MNVKNLFPIWPDIIEISKKYAAQDDHSFGVQSFTGISYILFRLGECGTSSLCITDEDHLTSVAQDIRSYQSITGKLNDFSIGFLSSDTPLENRALLEESLCKKGLIWITTEEFLTENFNIPYKKEFMKSRIYLQVGKIAHYSQLIRDLSNRGYKRADLVEEPGEFSSRGEIIDFWTPSLENPVRIIFAHDTVETMHSFDPNTQRTIQFIPELFIVALPQTLGGTKTEKSSLLQYFPTPFLIFKHDPVAGFNFQISPVGECGLNWKIYKYELENHSKNKIKDFLFCQNMGEFERMQDIFDELNIEKELRPFLIIAPLSEGFIVSPLKICVRSFNDLTGKKPIYRRKIKLRLGSPMEDLAQISPGDYVVHERFGIAKYKGFEEVRLKIKRKKIPTSWVHKEHEKISEFLVLEYKGGDRLLVPTQDFKFIQKYVGQEGKKPALYSLDGVAWNTLLQKTKKELAEMAEDLLKTAAMRSSCVRAGTASMEEGSLNLLNEFLAAFPYDETADQKRATEEIFRDLDSPQLMERLLCGDVGFGKTEVAMRAACKTVLESKQVAVLVPTTILAEQHLLNFRERFASFPVKIEILSRFQSKQDQNLILGDLTKGVIDILIGTHRLLSKDVEFKNLGLLIIDEEHRFGVAQKENLKKAKTECDVLSLSATPIPRSLTFALGGAKDISLIETAPEGRIAIQTHVGVGDVNLLKEAISREISRGGQIFYVYNHIQTIHKEMERLSALFSNLKIGIAHGQMQSAALESAMWSFLHKKWDILLSTSIIESGLDIPNVNTIIIQDCQEFGLAQLYQLRGRVGRTKTKAYCYLFFSDWDRMSEDAHKRLGAIQEFSSLGSGFRLSIRDMEIRGAGELLGAKQHGWIQSVGLELYCKLLSEEMEKLKGSKALSRVGEQKVELPEITLDLPATIPESYCPNPGERISLYKKLGAIENSDELERLRNEILDRFGPLPEEVENLFQTLMLRIQAHKEGLSAVTETSNGILFTWPVKEGKIPLNIEKFAEEYPDLIELQPPRNDNAFSILFKEEMTQGISPIIKILQICAKYITITNL